MAIDCAGAVSTPRHGHNLILLFVLCRVDSKTELLGYGENMVMVCWVGDIYALKLMLKVPKMTIFESFFGVRTAQHGLILVVLYVLSKVHFMNKLLSLGKNMVTVGWFYYICTLKLSIFVLWWPPQCLTMGTISPNIFFRFLGWTCYYLDRICITRDLMYVFHYRIWNSTQKLPFCGEGGKKFIKIFWYKKSGITR